MIPIQRMMQSTVSPTPTQRSTPTQRNAQNARGHRAAIIIAVTAALLVCVTASGIVVGSTSIGLSDLLALTLGASADQTAANVICNIRVPRVLAALLAGAALAQAGALIQAALDNPLASPNVIGVNAGAGFFVLLAACVFPNAFALAPAAAFLGALIVAGLIFGIATLGGSSRLTVVLAGMAFTAIFTAGMNTILIVDPDAYVGSSGFLTGGLSGVKLSEVIVPGIAICIALVLGLLQGQRLNLLALGDQQAYSLGLNVQRTRLAALATAAALAGCAVSFAGLVGFVGLIVPHVARSLTGHDNRIVLLASPVMGALLVCLCDLLARTLFSPYEIPVGIVLSLLGGPFFVYLILRKGKGGLDG